MRDIEHADTAADRQVLGLHALVLHRHLPAGERDELRARGFVPIVQGRVAKLGSGGRSHITQGIVAPAGLGPDTAVAETLTILEERRDVDLVVANLERGALAVVHRDLSPAR